MKMDELGSKLSKLNKLSSKELETFVEGLISGVAKRFKQEMLGEWGEESSDRILRQHRAKIVRYGWKEAQKWCKWDEDGPVLMPDHTRLYYRKGVTEIVIKELPPQIRIMKFLGSLVSRNNTEELIEPEVASKIHNFSLALPYVIFIFKFNNGIFQEVKCAFSDRPLKRLEERPLRPYLSNIDTNLSVCLGPTFNRKELIKDNIFQQTSYILSNFWQTVYSDEWSTHYWNSKRHFKDNKDKRMENIQSWQEASLDNSLFVIEDVDWLKHNEDSFGDIIVRMFDNDVVNNNIHEEIYTSLVDNFLDDLKKTISDDLSSVNDKINTESMAKDIEELLK